MLRELHRAGVKPFHSMRGPFIDWDRTVSIPVSPIKTNEMTWNDGLALGTGSDPYLIFALDRPVFVLAIRLVYEDEGSPSDANCEFYWSQTGRNEFTETERYYRWQQPTIPISGNDPSHYKDIVINDWIDRLRVDPDNKPCKFRLNRIELLVP
jgi:hypothetical protein